MNNKQKQRAKQLRKETSRRNSRSEPKVNLIEDAWLGSLADPWSVHGVRIPDDIIAPSATASYRKRFTIAGIQSSTDPTKYGCAVVFVPTLFNAWKTATAYNSTTTSFTLSVPASFDGYATTLGLARAYRVVSAGMAIYTTTAFAANAGRNLCAFYPGNDRADNPFTSAVTSNTLLVAENSEDKPVNLQTVCSTVWVPSDGTNYNYHDLDSAATGPYSPFGPKWHYPGTLAWIADGIQAGATFEVCLVLNIEFQPITNATAFFPILPSLYNVRAMEKALNSKLVTSMFGTAEPKSIMTAQGNNDLGFSALAGQLLSNFGSGAADVLAPYARTIGRAVGNVGIAAALRAGSRRFPAYRSLMGINT